MLYIDQALRRAAGEASTALTSTILALDGAVPTGSCRDHYQAIRGKGAGHDEAFRGVLARVLASPAFLFRIDDAPLQRKIGIYERFAA